MQVLGTIGDRQILYTNVRTDQTWLEFVPTDNWLAFTVADENEEIVKEVVKLCLDKSVCYICCAGRICGLTEFFFDEEIVERAIRLEAQAGEEFDYEFSPMTTAHKNFSDGFWFASIAAVDGHKHIDMVICIDFTIKGVKGHLIDLVAKIKNDWLPSDEEFEDPTYDH